MRVPAIVAITILSAGAAYAQVGVGSVVNEGANTGIDSATGTGIDSAAGAGIDSATGIGSDAGVSTHDTVKGGADVDTGVTGDTPVGVDAKAKANANVGTDTKAKGYARTRTHESSFTAVTIEPSLVGRSVYSQSGRLIGSIDWASSTGLGASVALNEDIAVGKPSVMMARGQLATNADGNLVANMSDSELDAFIHSRVENVSSATLSTE